MNHLMQYHQNKGRHQKEEHFCHREINAALWILCKEENSRHRKKRQHNHHCKHIGPHHIHGQIHSLISLFLHAAAQLLIPFIPGLFLL